MTDIQIAGPNIPINGPLMVYVAAMRKLGYQVSWAVIYHEGERYQALMLEPLPHPTQMPNNPLPAD
jgi:hypothetical protein